MKDGRKMACWGAAGFIGSALLIVAASPAHGQPPVEVVAQKAYTRIVPFGDLSLATKAGQKILFRRVGYAVREVCPDQDETGAYYNADHCKKFAWQGARPQINRAIDRAMSGSKMAMTITIQAAAK